MSLGVLQNTQSTNEPTNQPKAQNPQKATSSLQVPDCIVALAFVLQW